MRTRSIIGFTLIEMLTVIVIIGIILAAGVPSMMKLMKSGGLSAGSRQVANTLSLARQYAITQRTTTRVVFPYSATGTTGVGTNRAPLYQSYAVYAMGTNAYISKWEYLPAGTVFMDNVTTYVSPAVPSLNNLATTSMSFPSNGVTSNIVAYIEFKPTGAASQSGSFTITEGFMDAGTTPRPTSLNGSTLANVTTVSVDNVVGRIKVTRP